MVAGLETKHFLTLCGNIIFYVGNHLLNYFRVFLLTLYLYYCNQTCLLFCTVKTGRNRFKIIKTNSVLTHIGWTVGRGVLWQVENFTLGHSWRNVGVGSIVPAHARRWRWPQRVGACHMWCLRDTIVFVAEFRIASYYCLESHKTMFRNNVKDSEKLSLNITHNKHRTNMVGKLQQVHWLTHVSSLIQLLLNNVIDMGCWS